MRILLATRNPHKVSELSAILGPAWSCAGLRDFPEAPDVEENGVTLEENAVRKARACARACGAWTLADDTGLEVEALGGAPGVRSARYGGDHDGRANNEKLLRELKGVSGAARRAVFRTVAACASPEGDFWTAEGRLEGLIAEFPRGAGGFGYDSLFLLPDLGKTLAELGEGEKNALSHRGKALRALIERLPSGRIGA